MEPDGTYFTKPVFFYVFLLEGVYRLSFCFHVSWRFHFLLFVGFEHHQLGASVVTPSRPSRPWGERKSTVTTSVQTIPLMSCSTVDASICALSADRRAGKDTGHSACFRDRASVATPSLESLGMTFIRKSIWGECHSPKLNLGPIYIYI